MDDGREVQVNKEECYSEPSTVNIQGRKRDSSRSENVGIDDHSWGSASF
jgi:hypothetical protein